MRARLEKLTAGRRLWVLLGAAKPLTTRSNWTN